MANLTPARRATLKAYIQTSPDLLSHLAAGRPRAVALALNTEAAPAFTVWRSDAPIAEILDGGFRWQDVPAVSPENYRIWDLMVRKGSIDASRNTVRQGITTCWGSGTPQETAILAQCKRPATLAEKLLANTLGGDGTAAAPARAVWEGTLTDDDIDQIMR